MTTPVHIKLNIHEGSLLVEFDDFEVFDFVEDLLREEAGIDYDNIQLNTTESGRAWVMVFTQREVHG